MLMQEEVGALLLLSQPHAGDYYALCSSALGLVPKHFHCSVMSITWSHGISSREGISLTDLLSTEVAPVVNETPESQYIRPCSEYVDRNNLGLFSD